MIDVVDEEDNVVDTVPRSEMRKRNLKHRMVCFFVFNSKGEVLITKRANTKDIDPGLYELPAGCVLSGETYDECAKRELEEEIGIRNALLKHVFDITYNDERRNEFIKVYSLTHNGTIAPQDGEVESYFFVNLEELPKKIKELDFCKNRIKVIEKYLELRK